MSTNRVTSDLLRGNTDTMILRLLTEADRYGYEIVKLINERSQGEYELKEATMYSSVRRLEADGDITWLKGCTFRRARLVRTDFSTSGLHDVRFEDAALTDVAFRQTDLRRTVFVRCTFTGVDFSQSDLRGLTFDGESFTGVKFDQAALEGVSLRGAILRDCSFRGGWTKKYYRALRTVDFDGARMDKLTYAALKGFGFEPAGVIVE